MSKNHENANMPQFEEEKDELIDIPDPLPLFVSDKEMDLAINEDEEIEDEDESIL